MSSIPWITHLDWCVNIDLIIMWKEITIWWITMELISNERRNNENKGENEYERSISREITFSFRASCSLSSRRYFSLKDISLSSFCPKSSHIKAKSSYKTEKEVKNSSEW